MPGSYRYRTIFDVMAAHPGRSLRCPECGTNEVRFSAANLLSIAECFDCAASQEGEDAEALFLSWSRENASEAMMSRGSVRLALGKSAASARRSTGR